MHSIPTTPPFASDVMQLSFHAKGNTHPNSPKTVQVQQLVSRVQIPRLRQGVCFTFLRKLVGL